MDFDNVRVAALLVLAISAPLSGENSSKIPPTIFSYAVTLLGRISDALSDVMDQSDLLAYLSQCSKSTRLSVVEFKEGEQCFPLVKGDIQDYSNVDIICSAAMPLQQKINGRFETSLLDCKLEGHDEIIKSMTAIIARVKDIWPLAQSGDVYQVLRILRFYLPFYSLLLNMSWLHIVKGHASVLIFLNIRETKILARELVCN